MSFILWVTVSETQWPRAMARLGEQLQKLIEPVIRDFIESMEPGVPRVEIESRRKEKFLCSFDAFQEISLWTKAFVQGRFQHFKW